MLTQKAQIQKTQIPTQAWKTQAWKTQAWKTQAWKTTQLLFLVLVVLAATGLVAEEGAESVESPAKSFEPWVGEIEGRQYFAVSVSDVDAAIEWYRRALGVEVLDDTTAENDAWRIANLASASLSVELFRDRRDEVVERAKGFAKVGFAVPDVEDVADRVEKATGERPRIVDFRRHEVRILQLKDPEGNTIQLFSPLPSQGP